jgi:hypothetical protein
MDDAFNRPAEDGVDPIGLKQLSKLEEAKEIEIRDNTGEEIIVHWVNKYGVPMDIKTRRGGMIHALWQAEHERRNRKRLQGAQTIEQPKIVQALDIECEVKQLPEGDHRNL